MIRRLLILAYSTAILGIILVVLAVQARGSELDEFTREDRVTHFAGGAAIGATTYALVQTVAPGGFHGFRVDVETGPDLYVEVTELA